MIRSSGGSLANSLTLNGGAGLRNGGTYSGPVTVNGASYFNLNANNLTISGNVSGPGGWSVNGTATLTNNSALLSGINTYTGPTTVNNGTLRAGRASVANVSGAFGLNSAVTMANSATARIDLNSFDTVMLTNIDANENDPQLFVVRHCSTLRYSIRDRKVRFV